jgi:hypothetical protein
MLSELYKDCFLLLLNISQTVDVASLACTNKHFYGICKPFLMKKLKAKSDRRFMNNPSQYTMKLREAISNEMLPLTFTLTGSADYFIDRIAKLCMYANECKLYSDIEFEFEKNYLMLTYISEDAYGECTKERYKLFHTEEAFPHKYVYTLDDGLLHELHAYLELETDAYEYCLSVLKITMEKDCTLSVITLEHENAKEIDT